MLIEQTAPLRAQSKRVQARKAVSERLSKHVSTRIQDVSAEVSTQLSFKKDSKSNSTAPIMHSRTMIIGIIFRIRT